MINKLKKGYRTVGFANSGLDNEGLPMFYLNFIQNTNINGKREVKMFKNNNTDIDFPFVLIGKKKLDVNDEFSDLESIL